MAQTTRKGKNQSGGTYTMRLVIAEATLTKDGKVQILDAQGIVDALADTLQGAIETPKIGVGYSTSQTNL